MTNYGIPYIFEDKTGCLSGSEFSELHDRMYLYLKSVKNSPSHSAYIVYEWLNGASLNPMHHESSIGLDFGPGGALGTITVGTKGKHVPMNQFLAKTSSMGSSKIRRFTASDNQTYTWSWRDEASEWICYNSNEYLVSSYALKPASEPEYHNSSGSLFTVEEDYPHLAIELLATLTIMRHIDHYNL